MKRRATDADVNAFLEAVYPGMAALATAAYDEATVLREATRQLREWDAALALLREYLDSQSQCREASRQRICLNHGWEWPCLIHRMRALLAAHGES